MKRNLKAALAALCIAGLVTSCGGGQMGGQGRRGQGGPMGMGQSNRNSQTAVETQEIEYASIENEYMYTGTITPSDEVNVNSAISGKVAAVNFDVGDKVNKGDVLFTMDTTNINNSIAVSEASVNSAQASVNSAQTSLTYANGASTQSQIENAKNNITTAEDNLKSAQNMVETEELNLKTAENTVENEKINLQTSENTLNNEKINLDNAKKDYDTNLELYNVGGISKEQIDNYEDTYKKAQTSYDNAVLNNEKAKSSYSTAQINYEKAKKSCETANLNYGKAEKSLAQAKTSYDITANQSTKENTIKAENSLAQAQAQKKSAEAQLRSSRQNLTDATVTSPISGVVAQCNITAGTNTSGGSVPFVIIDLDTVTIKINVSEQMINTVNKGDKVRVKVSALSSDTFDGSVTTVAPDANPDGTYTVEIDVPNQDGKLRSGMFAEAYFIREKSDNTFVVPRSTVITKNDESYVFTVENGTAKKNIVQTGIDNGDKIEITNGIKIGDKVVVKGQTYLTDGAAVVDVTNGVPQEAVDADQSAPDANGGMPGGNAPDKKDGSANNGNSPSDGNAPQGKRSKEGK